MPYIPHTEEEVRQMLDTIGVQDIEDLFDEIPQSLRHKSLEGVPTQASEMDVNRLMHERAAKDGQPLCFMGAGAYDHHIPAAVWQITTRGEYYTAYTPYQAEASQGTLQLLYEYQTMMANLNALDVSNASLYDGASALAEAILMAVRANRNSQSKRILMPANVHPNYRKTAEAIVRNQGITFEVINYDQSSGCIDPASLPAEPGDFAALIIPQPNFFGGLEDVNVLTDWAHRHKSLVIGVVNPIALAVLAPPGDWGNDGADIACGEGQPLGIPMSSGGPFYGFMCCKQALVRQMPGRIIGRTVDLEGKPGFTLTLQAREQHIRRSKATSNICTNQGLMITASTIHMALLGADGLERVALASHDNTRKLVEKLTAIDGVEAVFNNAYFHEVVIQLSAPLAEVMRALHAQNLLPGFALQEDYPELENCLLVCATEMRNDEDIETYANHLQRIMSKL